MERRQLPDKAQGDILWLDKEKALVTTWTRSTPVNGKPRCWVMLWYTSDGGQTWVKKWPGQGRSLELEIGVNSAIGFENRTSLVQDYQGNIYIHRSNKVIRAYKNGPEAWDNFDGFTIPQWPAGYVRAPLVFAEGKNQLFILAVIGGRWTEFTTKNLTKWSTYVRIDERTRTVQLPRAGFMFNNLARWLYLVNEDNSWKIQLAGRIDNMARYPSETVYTKSGNTQRIGAVSALVDITGKIHLVWTEADTKNIYHMMKIGPTWTIPEVIGEYTGHSVNSLEDTSATSITSGYPVESANAQFAPYLTVHHDGIGLMVTFAEVTNAPASNPRTFNLKKISFDGTSWGDVELVDDGLSFTSNGSTLFKYIGPTNNTRNFGIHSLIIRDGIESDDLYFYPLTNPYQPYAPKGLAPANGLASEDLERPLSWIFSDPVPGDTQSAYQIEIVRQSDAVLMWDSGKVTSTANTINIPTEADLVLGVAYQWRVKTWDLDDLEGAWSDYALFKTSAKPVAEVIAPTADEVLEINEPTIEWTYSDAEGLAQIGVQVQIVDPATDEPIYDSELIATAETEFKIPPQVLQNGGTYIVRVRVQDQDGIISEPADQTFSIEYVAPPIPTVLPNVDEFGGIVLNITSENAPNDSWFEDYFKVYRKRVGDPDFELYEASVLIPNEVIDEFETVAGWGAIGVADDPELVDPKQGSYALGFGTTGAGNSANTKSVGVFADQFDQLQVWLYVEDKTQFDFIRLRLGTNLQNYYYIDIDNEEFTDDTWQSFKFNIDSMFVNGTPRRNTVTTIGLEIRGATGVLTPGAVRSDKWRLLQSNINYYDRATTIGEQYIYGVSSYANEGALESAMQQTAPQLSKFTAPYVNVQLIPQDVEDVSIEGFMDGTKPPSWTSKTDTEYYYPKGSTKPVVVINAMQNYREGSMEIRFFDARFGGQGLEAAELLEAMKNSKPILLRTWWGRNYFISIDGEVDIKRDSGIGWYATFQFTEINP